MILKQGIDKKYFENTKIKVTPKESRILQEELFKLGICWTKTGNVVENAIYPYLFIYKDFLFYGTVSEEFGRHDNKEIYFNDIFESELSEYKLTKTDIAVLTILHEENGSTYDYIFSDESVDWEDFSDMKVVVNNLINLGYVNPSNTFIDCLTISQKGFWYLKELSAINQGKVVHEKMENMITEGYKESNGKLHVEYPWQYLAAQMQRIGLNKDKYPRDNWKKPMDVEELKYALFRHVLEVMNGNYADGTELGHIEAIGVNAGLIWYQLNNK
jgi:hypothetical protein